MKKKRITRDQLLKRIKELEAEVSVYQYAVENRILYKVHHNFIETNESNENNKDEIVMEKPNSHNKLQGLFHNYVENEHVHVGIIEFGDNGKVSTIKSCECSYCVPKTDQSNESDKGLTLGKTTGSSVGPDAYSKAFTCTCPPNHICGICLYNKA